MQHIYDAYCAAIRRGMKEAAQLEWCAPESRPVVFLSLDGLVGIVDRTHFGIILTTAFLAGQTSTVAIARSKGQDTPRRWRDCPRPLREQIRTTRIVLGARETARQARREASWSHEERIYHKVFNPSVQSVRSMQYDQVGDRNHIALLKERLPMKSQLNYQSWRALRETVRGGVAAERN